MKAIIIGAVLVLATAAHAEDWRARAPKCGEAIAQKLGCASCSAQWAEISRCTFGRTPVVEQCLHKVNAATAGLEMGHDRVADVAACLGIK